MKFTIALFFGIAYLLAISSARPAEEEYADYEEEPAPPPKPVARNPLIGRRNPLAGRAGVSKPTSTTAAPPPAKEEEVVEEEQVEEEVAQESTSTTESPKKLKTGILRPFRSNEDLLATLKRRREQSANNKLHPKPTQHTEEEAEHNSEPAPKASRPQSNHNVGRRRYNNNKNEAPAATQEVQEGSSTSTPNRAGRRFSARN